MLSNETSRISEEGNISSPDNAPPPFSLVLVFSGHVLKSVAENPSNKEKSNGNCSNNPIAENFFTF